MTRLDAWINRLSNYLGEDLPLRDNTKTIIVLNADAVEQIRALLVEYKELRKKK